MKLMRAEITIKFTVDLDRIPGWGHQPEDWINLATADVLRQKHYNTSAETLSVDVKPAEPTVGLDWEISEKTKAEIEAIEDNLRRAPSDIGR